MRLVPFLTALLLAGCGATWTREHPLLCPLGEERLQRDTLYFGLSRPDGTRITAAEWDGFEQARLAAAFPKGFTVLDAHGHWRGADGASVAEDSRVVVILHPFDAASEHAIVDVARWYRQQFAQESVLRERAVVCASF